MKGNLAWECSVPATAFFLAGRLSSQSSAEFPETA